MSERAPAAPDGWKPWRMDELASPSAPAAAAPAPTAATQGFRQQSELKQLREKTRLEAWREGHAAGLAEGREKGYRDGLEQGRQAGQAQLETERDTLTAALGALLHGMQQALTDFETEAGEAMTDVALATGYRLAGEAVDAHASQALSVVRELLHEEPLFGGQPRLWLHPDDLALIQPQLAGELEAAGWKALPDAALQRGDCRLTGPEGELDATRETRWQSLLAHARRPRQGAGPPAPVGSRAEHAT